MTFSRLGSNIKLQGGKLIIITLENPIKLGGGGKYLNK